MTSPQEAGMSLTREQIDDILPSTGEMKVDALLCYRARDVKALCDMALRSVAPEGTSEDEELVQDWLEEDFRELYDIEWPSKTIAINKVLAAFTRLMSRPNAGWDLREVAVAVHDYSVSVGKQINMTEAHWRELEKIISYAAPNAGIPEGWQPIESAPKDGKAILLWFPYWSNLPMIVHWGINEFSRMSWIGEYILSDDKCHDDPIAWMPLPQTPATTGEP